MTPRPYPLFIAELTFVTQHYATVSRNIRMERVTAYAGRNPTRWRGWRIFLSVFNVYIRLRRRTTDTSSAPTASTRERSSRLSLSLSLSLSLYFSEIERSSFTVYYGLRIMCVIVRMREMEEQHDNPAEKSATTIAKMQK